MRIRKLVPIAAVVACLALPSAAEARVRLVSLTSPISHGSYATLTVAVSPARPCSITVQYYSGPSHAAGLYPKRPVGGRVSWTWKVGTDDAGTVANRCVVRIGRNAANVVRGHVADEGELPSSSSDVSVFDHRIGR